MTERRYGDEEVREIFALAATAGVSEPPLPDEPGGLTLAALQRIGEEAGIEPARVAEAALRLDARGTTAPMRKSFGLPIAMSQVVDLPRAPTDREWEQLISQFRSTFGAPGQAVTSGGHREWSRGDVHIAIEPTAHGEQLRLSTHNEAAQVLNGFGVLTGGMSLLTTAAVIAAGKPEKALAVLAMFGGMALAGFGTNVVRSPGWARLRTRQMEATAAQVVKLLSSP